MVHTEIKWFHINLTASREEISDICAFRGVWIAFSRNNTATYLLHREIFIIEDNFVDDKQPFRCICFHTPHQHRMMGDDLIAIKFTKVEEMNAWIIFYLYLVDKRVYWKDHNNCSRWGKDVLNNGLVNPFWTAQSTWEMARIIVKCASNFRKHF